MLTKHPKITDLRIQIWSNKAITDEACKAFMQLLASNTNLKSIMIHIGCNQITNDGFTYILEGLLASESLKRVYLDLRYTEIDDRIVAKIG